MSFMRSIMALAASMGLSRTQIHDGFYYDDHPYEKPYRGNKARTLKGDEQSLFDKSFGTKKGKRAIRRKNHVCS